MNSEPCLLFGCENINLHYNNATLEKAYLFEPVTVLDLGPEVGFLGLGIQGAHQQFERSSNLRRRVFYFTCRFFWTGRYRSSISNSCNPIRRVQSTYLSIMHVLDTDHLYFRVVLHSSVLEKDLCTDVAFRENLMHRWAKFQISPKYAHHLTPQYKSFCHRLNPKFL